MAVWREAPSFTARERAVLALTEAVTLIAQGEVDDGVWQQATTYFNEGELAHLLFTIASINALNRIGATVRQPPA